MVVPPALMPPFLLVGASLPNERKTLLVKRRRLQWQVRSRCSGESY